MERSIHQSPIRGLVLGSSRAGRSGEWGVGNLRVKAEAGKEVQLFQSVLLAPPQLTSTASLTVPPARFIPIPPPLKPETLLTTKSEQVYFGNSIK